MGFTDPKVSLSIQSHSPHRAIEGMAFERCSEGTSLEMHPVDHRAGRGQLFYMSNRLRVSIHVICKFLFRNDFTLTEKLQK